MRIFTTEVNPYLEFMNSVLLTSKYNELTIPMIGYGLMTDTINDYTDSIRKHFNSYINSPIYNSIEALIPKGFTFSRPVELMLSLNNSRDFTIQFKISDLCVEYSGGNNSIHCILSQLKELYYQCDYNSFFNKHVDFYKPYLKAVNKHIDAYPFIEMLESQYGKYQNSYQYVISFLMKANFGISFYNQELQKADLFSVFTIDELNENADENEFNRGALSVNVLFHEFSHPFINPLTEKYREIVNNYQKTYEYLKQFKLPEYRSGYGDWTECVNEHFVRAMAIHLLKKCDREEWARKYLDDDLYCGYKYIPLILEYYTYYDKNRNRYKTFDDFYPSLIKVFGANI